MLLGVTRPKTRKIYLEAICTLIRYGIPSNIAHAAFKPLYSVLDVNVVVKNFSPLQYLFLANDLRRLGINCRVYNLDMKTIDIIKEGLSQGRYVQGKTSVN